MPTSGKLEELRALEPYEFEHFVANLWEDKGWQTHVLPESNDYGIDVVATKSDPTPQKILIQAKRYAEDNRVGAPDVQQYRSLLEQEPDADSVVIVTTSSFTKQAQEIADRVNVKLVDGDALLKIVDEGGMPSETPTTTTTGAQSNDEGGLVWDVLASAARNPDKVLELLVTGFIAIVLIYAFGEALWTLMF